jgi:hypothetical protein
VEEGKKGTRPNNVRHKNSSAGVTAFSTSATVSRGLA